MSNGKSKLQKDIYSMTIFLKFKHKQSNAADCTFKQSCMKMISTIFKMVVNSRGEKGKIRRDLWNGSNLFVIFGFFLKNI